MNATPDDRLLGLITTIEPRRARDGADHDGSRRGENRSFARAFAPGRTSFPVGRGLRSVMTTDHWVLNARPAQGRVGAFLSRRDSHHPLSLAPALVASPPDLGADAMIRARRGIRAGTHDRALEGSSIADRSQLANVDFATAGIGPRVARSWPRCDTPPRRKGVPPQ